jgi:hypothetical protein
MPARWDSACRRALVRAGVEFNRGQNCAESRATDATRGLGTERDKAIGRLLDAE